MSVVYLNKFSRTRRGKINRLKFLALHYALPTFVVVAVVAVVAWSRVP